MPRLLHLVSAFACMVPTVAAASTPVASLLAQPNAAESEAAFTDGALGDLSGALDEDSWAQVRIEQRLIIRIAPGNPGDAARLPPMELPQLHFQGRRAMNCVPVGLIGGLRVSTESRLVLFMRDRRFVGATLAKGCNAQDFYQGFYVEQHGDGQLCVARDTIHSRAGASCALSGLKELVPSP